MTRAWTHVERLVSTQRCVVLDGGIATELAERLAPDATLDERLWGTGALVSAPEQVLEVHRRYVDVGCDVISTDTWGLPGVLRPGGPRLWDSSRALHWVDLARAGLRLAREAVTAAGREDECAVAFSLGGDLDVPSGPETVAVLSRLFAEEPPDLVLLETLSLVRPSTYQTVQALLGTGVPLWLSFRRCRQGVCGVHGEHWGGPEGDTFGRAARQFEEMGVSALLANCVPPDHLAGLMSWLRDFTDIPLGVYPNLGYHSVRGWRLDREVSGERYADLALGWRQEGAQIVGGCCGVGPDHIAAAKERLRDVPPGRVDPRSAGVNGLRADVTASNADDPQLAWTDDSGRDVYPLPVPPLLCEPGVFVPTQGSFLVWKHLFRERVGAGARCLDIGCGTGLLTVQLALNGAEHVHAIDLEPQAVANTLTTAFRNGVADRVSGAPQDLYPWVPEERYDVVVASLYQMPVDPYEQSVTHRPLDYWGRMAVDQLIGKLPHALAPGGVAYVMQLSLLSQRRTARLVDQAGLTARVVDYAFFEFPELFQQRLAQIRRVEEQSDAYHLEFDAHDVMVAYLLEIKHKTDGAG